MKTRNFLSVALLLFVLSVSAQEYKVKYYKTPNPIETKDYKISFKDIVSKFDYIKMAVIIDNYSDDYLLMKNQENKFILAFGDYKSKPKVSYVLPRKTRKQTLKVDGDTRFLVDSFTVAINGLYKLKAKGEVIKLDDFQIPASKNIVKTDAFTIHLLKQKKSTKETYLLFECTYNGDKVGIIDAKNISVKVEGKDEVYANDDKKAKTRFLQKGEKTKIKAIFHIPGRVADMQFANMIMQWNDTFIESTPEKINKTKVKFVIDRGLTHAKN